MSPPAVAWRSRRFGAVSVKTGKHLYEFGDFRLDITERLLFRGEAPVRLPPKVFDTLRILVENSGRLLEKDELLRRVWPDTFVEENSLNKSISFLRKTFGERLADCCYIQTVPKAGYRFIALVTERRDESEETPHSELSQEPKVGGGEGEEGPGLSNKLANAIPEPRLVADEQAARKLPAPQMSRNALLGSAVLLMLLGFTYSMLPRRGEADAAAARATAPRGKTLRRSVAVWGLKNMAAPPEVEWLSTAFPEMLTTELAASDDVRVIPEENVARVKLQLRLGDADTLSKDTLARVCRSLGADLVVVGSYRVLGTPEGEQIRLDLRLQEAKQGKTIAVVTETGTEAGLFELVSRSGARLREKLGLGEVTTPQAASISTSLYSITTAHRAALRRWSDASAPF